MCHDVDSMPAVPCKAGKAINSRRLQLTASDGCSLPAYLSVPMESPGAGVIVLPDNRGLSSFYETLSCRIAELGNAALAIDYYGRTAGAPWARSSNFASMEHLLRVTRPGLEADLAAATQFLRSVDGGNCSAVFALGFCFGGRQAYLAATLGHRLAGVIGFYGFPGAINGAAGPTARAAHMDAPVLAVWAGGDQIDHEQVQAFLDAMTDHGVEYESVIYPGAPHSFFDIKQTEWTEASADAWKRVCGFLDKHSAVTPARGAPRTLIRESESAAHDE